MNWKFMLLTLVWYSFSMMETIVDKEFYKTYPLPISVTFSHMIVSPLGFYFAAWYSGAPKILMSRSQLFPVLCLAVFKSSVSIFSHYTQFFLTVQLMETLKILSPIFVVGATKLIYGTVYTSNIYMSLAMMVVGAFIATFTEHKVVFEGIFTSVLMVISSQSQNLFLKHCYGSLQLNPFALLFNVYLFGTLIVLPIWMVYDVPLLISHPSFQSNPWEYLSTFTIQGSLSLVTHIVKSIILSRFSSLTYSFTETGKALSKIVLGFVRFQRPTGIVNVTGTLLAISGIFLYSQTKVKERKKNE